MSGPDDRKIAALAAVVELRERDKSRLMRELANQRALAERYRNNLARLEELCASAGASAATNGAQLSVMSQNRGDYKQAVMHMAASHRGDLQLQEAEVNAAQLALTRAVHRHEALDQVLCRRREDQQTGASRQDQKRQDELANQSWWRGQA